MTALLWRFCVAIGVLVVIGLLAAAAVLPGTAQHDGLEPRVDAIFAPWTERNTPGCSVAVMRGRRFAVRQGLRRRQPRI